VHIPTPDARLNLGKTPRTTVFEATHQLFSFPEVCSSAWTASIYLGSSAQRVVSTSTWRVCEAIDRSNMLQSYVLVYFDMHTGHDLRGWQWSRIYIIVDGSRKGSNSWELDFACGLP